MRHPLDNQDQELQPKKKFEDHWQKQTGMIKIDFYVTQSYLVWHFSDFTIIDKIILPANFDIFDLNFFCLIGIFFQKFKNLFRGRSNILTISLINSSQTTIKKLKVQN